MLLSSRGIVVRVQRVAVQRVERIGVESVRVERVAIERVECFVRFGAIERFESIRVE